MGLRGRADGAGWERGFTGPGAALRVRARGGGTTLPDSVQRAIQRRLHGVSMRGLTGRRTRCLMRGLRGWATAPLWEPGALLGPQRGSQPRCGLEGAGSTAGATAQPSSPQRRCGSRWHCRGHSAAHSPAATLWEPVALPGPQRGSQPRCDAVGAGSTAGAISAAHNPAATLWEPGALLGPSAPQPGNLAAHNLAAHNLAAPPPLHRGSPDHWERSCYPTSRPTTVLWAGKNPL